MTLKQLIARVMRALPATTPGSIGENDIIDILNQGQLHLSRVSAKKIVYQHALEEDYDIVPFPSDLHIIARVYWESDNVSRELYPDKEPLPVDEELDDTEDTADEPNRYYVLGRRLAIRPVPAVDGTVSIYYVPKPTTMASDTDEPDLDGSDEYLIAFALHRLHLEANSPVFQLWEMEKAKEEYTWLQTANQNYETPFQVEQRW
jgi:hypothetical protein